MDEILLYLSLKHFGEWMAIYDSLQKKEELKVYDIKKAVNEVDADWITLIGSDYPTNLKKIYKPPFGIFSYGKSKLLHQDIVTIFGSINEKNEDQLTAMYKAGLTLLWPKRTNSEILNVLSRFPSNNIFYLEELKNANNKTFQNILSNENVIMENVFCSEIWERKEKIDYSNQWQERLYLGLSLRALIISEIKNKELILLSKYCEKENIKIAILKHAYTHKIEKALTKNRIFVIDDLSQIQLIFNKND